MLLLKSTKPTNLRVGAEEHDAMGLADLFLGEG